MDATLQEIWTPLGTFDERKRFFSGKHKLYGLKSLTLHNRLGILLASWSGVPGSVHDLTIAREHVDEIQEFLAKDEEEQQEEGETWAVLVDTGFVGLEHNLNAMHPFKRAAGRDLNYNRRLAGQRVICERWYGRLKSRHRIMASKYRNDRDDYVTHFQLCAALTNFTVMVAPELLSDAGSRDATPGPIVASSHSSAKPFFSESVLAASTGVLDPCMENLPVLFCDASLAPSWNPFDAFFVIHSSINYYLDLWTLPVTLDSNLLCQLPRSFTLPCRARPSQHKI